MFRFAEALTVFGMLLALAASGYNLKWMERQMKSLAIESYKSGYISIAEFHHKLEEPSQKKGR